MCKRQEGFVIVFVKQNSHVMFMSMHLRVHVANQYTMERRKYIALVSTHHSATKIWPNANVPNRNACLLDWLHFRPTILCHSSSSSGLQEHTQQTRAHTEHRYASSFIPPPFFEHRLGCSAQKPQPPRHGDFCIFSLSFPRVSLWIAHLVGVDRLGTLKHEPESFGASNLSPVGPHVEMHRVEGRRAGAGGLAGKGSNAYRHDRVTGDKCRYYVNLYIMPRTATRPPVWNHRILSPLHCMLQRNAPKLTLPLPCPPWQLTHVVRPLPISDLSLCHEHARGLKPCDRNTETKEQQRTKPWLVARAWVHHVLLWIATNGVLTICDLNSIGRRRSSHGGGADEIEAAEN